MTGRPQAIRLSELSAAEGRAIFNDYVAGQPQRLGEFVAEVRRRGGPADRLDQSLESLDPLWSWFIAEHQPRRWFGGSHRMPASPVPDEDMRAADPPWWYDFHPPIAQELGPYLARLVTGMADYVFACALRARPTSRWAVGRSSAHLRHPVLEIDGRGERHYLTPITMALLGLRGERNTEPDAARRWLEQWLGMDPAWEAEMERLSRPLGAYAVELIDDPNFTHLVSFADDVAHRQERRIDRLVEQLASEPGVEEAVHEDREVVLVQAPGLSAADLEAIVARLWERRAAGSHAERS
ncbi:MAG TPA: hypothetical protein VEW95_12750 [Candidatus Limnocylindrales bacterium]|nr:hypothetical protein [Candidatus Limnocylindrales bacterium]